MRLRGDTSGLVQRTIRRMPTAWASIAALSIRRTWAIVVTVAPYAAPRSRIDSNAEQYYPSRVTQRMAIPLPRGNPVFTET